LLCYIIFIFNNNDIPLFKNEKNKNKHKEFVVGKNLSNGANRSAF